MRIAITHSSFCTSGGMERLPLLQALFLKKKRHRVSVFASVVDKKKCYPEITKKLLVRPYSFSLPTPTFGKGINHVFSLALILKPSMLRSFDALFCHTQPSPWLCYSAKRRYGVPYIHYAQGICRRLYPREVDLQTSEQWDLERKVETHFFKISKLFYKLDFFAINEADAIIANSKFISEEIKKVYGRKDAVVCYPGVDFNEFKPLPHHQSEYVIEKFSIRRPFLFSTNRHESHKRLEWLIEILPLVVREYPSVTLVLTGAFTKFYTPFLRRLAKRLNVEKNVVFTGAISERDLVSLYNQSDLYLLSSPQEDFGLGPVEAMACGTPVVAWNYAGPRETVVDGATGYLAHLYDLGDFAEKILRILSDAKLQKIMKVKCLVHVRQKFTWKHHVNKLEAVLERAVGNR